METGIGLVTKAVLFAAGILGAATAALGYGNVLLPQDWRLIGGMAAAPAEITPRR